MPESDKSLKKKEQAKNRALGLGDENVLFSVHNYYFYYKYVTL